MSADIVCTQYDWQTKIEFPQQLFERPQATALSVNIGVAPLKNPSHTLWPQSQAGKIG